MSFLFLETVERVLPNLNLLGPLLGVILFLPKDLYSQRGDFRGL